MAVSGTRISHRVVVEYSEGKRQHERLGHTSEDNIKIDPIVLMGVD